MKAKWLKIFLKEIPDEGEIWIVTGKGLSSILAKVEKLNQKDVLLTPLNLDDCQDVTSAKREP